MSGSTPEIPDELHILAGEYVLGALDESEMRAVRRRVLVDPALGAAIAGWERRLSPLAGVVAPQAPPEALWSRLERAIAEVPQDEAQTARPLPVLPRPVAAPPSAEVLPLVPRPRAAPPPRRVWPWQMATVASLALAAGLAAIALVPSVALRFNLGAPQPQFAALMPSDGQGPGFLAQARADGSVVLTAFAPVTVPAGKDLELWILRPGAKAPASLGVLPASGKKVTLPGLPPEGTQLLVSMEPPGGSPSGAPTGPVVYGGTLKPLSI